MKVAMNNFFSAVLFDMDGLLVDSEPFWFEAEMELTAGFGYAWTAQDKSACLGGPLTHVGEYMYAKCNQAQSPAYFTQAIIELMVTKLVNGAPLMPGAAPLIKELASAQIPLAMVSASPRQIVDAALSAHPNLPFAITISSDDVARTKPFPDGYLKAAQHLGVDIEECLIFEDSLTGMRAAQSSGAYLIAVPHIVRVEEGARTRVVKSLAEISYQKLEKLYENFAAEI